MKDENMMDKCFENEIFSIVEKRGCASMIVSKITNVIFFSIQIIGDLSHDQG